MRHLRKVQKMIPAPSAPSEDGKKVISSFIRTSMPTVVGASAVIVISSPPLCSKRSPFITEVTYSVVICSYFCY